jgi:hypothetical protein
MWIQVLDHDEGHAGGRGQVFKQLGERFESTSGGANPHNREGWTAGGGLRRCDVRGGGIHTLSSRAAAVLLHALQSGTPRFGSCRFFLRCEQQHQKKRVDHRSDGTSQKPIPGVRIASTVPYQRLERKTTSRQDRTRYKS